MQGQVRKMERAVARKRKGWGPFEACGGVTGSVRSSQLGSGLPAEQYSTLFRHCFVHLSCTPVGLGFLVPLACTSTWCRPATGSEKIPAPAERWTTAALLKRLPRARVAIRTTTPGCHLIICKVYAKLNKVYLKYNNVYVMSNKVNVKSNKFYV